MKKYIPVIVVVVVVLAAALYYYDRSSQPAQPAPSSVAQQQTAPGAAAAPGAISGQVLETMDAGGYTYLHVDTGREKGWAAGPETPVNVGDRVSMPEGMRMEGFKSETLNRSFDVVYFVSAISVGGSPGQAPTQMPMGHPQPGSSEPDAESMDFSGIDVPGGGKNIAAVYAEKKSLEGKQVVVRGKVVKFTPGVMKKNWLHLRDGSGAEGTNDLTVTTNAMVQIGDLVVVRGVVSLDKDFGFGYRYEILVEDAEVTVE
jgi:hypothetical protein